MLAPKLVISFFAVAAIGFWLVRRYKDKYYQLCLFIYAMVLGGVLGLINDWIICHRILQ